MHILQSTLSLTAALAASAAFAGTPVTKKPDTGKTPSTYDNIWNSLTFYKDKDGVLLNEFKVVGRAHFDEYSTDSNLGHDQDWVVRRLRIGIKTAFFQNLTLHVEADLNPQNLGGPLFVGDPVYQKLTDAYVSWKFCDAAKLTAGKQSTKFTLDGGTSSNELITIDRNALTNTLWFTNEYISGVTLSGKLGSWHYNTGLFSGGSVYAPQGKFDRSSREFGNFNGGNFWLGSVGYDFARNLGAKKALLRADVVYNDPDSQSNTTKNFSWIESVNFEYDAGHWGFSTDLAAGNGSLGQSDVWGAVVMPWFNITDKLQVVGRYTYISSDDPNGIGFARYENTSAVNTDAFGNIRTDRFGKAGTQKGNEYNEAYVGLNYYLYGHKLKLQTGVDYAWMQDSRNDGGKFRGWTWTTGLRISW